MSRPDIPLFDIGAWRVAGIEERAALAARLDRAMRESGFFLVRGHGIDESLKEQVRAASRLFFALPDTVKDAYGTAVGGRGWIARGREANSYYGEVGDAEKGLFGRMYGWAGARHMDIRMIR